MTKVIVDVRQDGLESAVAFPHNSFLHRSGYIGYDHLPEGIKRPKTFRPEAFRQHDQFARGVLALKERGFSVITGEENARLRIKEGLDSIACLNENYIAQGVLYLPKDKAVLVPISDILDTTRINLQTPYNGFVYPIGSKLREKQEIADSEKETTIKKFRRNGIIYFPTENQIEKMLNGKHLVLEEEEVVLPSARLEDSEVARHIFGKATREYGEFLDSLGIKDIAFRIYNKKSLGWKKDCSFDYSKPFVFPLTLGAVGSCHSLNPLKISTEFGKYLISSISHSFFSTEPGIVRGIKYKDK